MHLQLYFILTMSCALNFWITYAYKPFVSLARTLSKSGHVKGLYRTMSELIPNIGQRSFPPLRMVSIMPNAPIKSDDQVRDIISWLKGVWIPPPITHTKTTAKHIITDEGLRTHVLGFMDYDPKSAAIASKNAHRKRGRTSKWFDF